MGYLFHYTDDAGYKAIRSQPAWTFAATQPPGNHPHGAYFTTLPPNTKNLAKRLRIPREKTEFTFCFTDVYDLLPLPGGRGESIFYCEEDYVVEESRQVLHGPRESVSEQLA
jgi:hypothetical protein